jgi:hypothetical protein
MSWSVSVIGKPESVAAKLDEIAGTLSGQSLEEYNEALPHLQGLVRQVVTTSDGHGSLVNLRASGHATFANGQKTYGQVSVALDPWYGTLAL